MNFFNHTQINYSDLRKMLRRGQIYAFDVEYSFYGGSASWRLFATVIYPELTFEKIVIGDTSTTKDELLTKFIDALSSEPPANFIHLMSGYPEKAICGVGRFAKLCGIERTHEIETFMQASNKCPKCQALSTRLESQKKEPGEEGSY